MNRDYPTTTTGRGEVKQDLARVSGSHASHEAPAGLRPSGFDPARGEPDRLCVDCVHFGTVHGFGAFNSFRGCKRPLTDRRSPIDGSLIDLVDASCESERKAGKTLFTRRRRCGPDGLYFDPKPGRRGVSK